jgi:transposase-like protein
VGEQNPHNCPQQRLNITISKSAVHYLAKRVSEISVAKEPRYRRCIAVDETKLSVKKSYVYVWSAVDVDSRNYWL